MVKKLLKAVLAATMMISLVACGSGETSKPESKAEEKTNTKTEVVEQEKETPKVEESTKVEPEIVLQLAEVHTAGYPTAMADEEFARLVNERTNGRIQIDVFTDGVLGEEAHAIEQMQAGNLGFARVSVSPMANFEPSLNALMMPYLYNNSEHMWKVLNSELGQSMLESISSADLVGLCWYDGGSRCFYTNKKVTTLEDLKGLTLRVQNNEMMFDLITALGANPMNCGMGDIPQAVQDGTIQGAENNIPTFESYGHDEVCHYYVNDNHSLVPEILIGSKKALSVLSEEDLEIIKQCAKETQEFEIKAWKEREVESKEAISKDNPEVEWCELEPGELEKFQAAVQSVYDKYGTEYTDIIEQIKAMG